MLLVWCVVVGVCPRSLGRCLCWYVYVPLILENEMTIRNSKLTFDELAVQYDKHHNGRRARTLQMKDVYAWAASRKDLFVVHEDTTLSYKVN